MSNRNDNADAGQAGKTPWRGTLSGSRAMAGLAGVLVLVLVVGYATLHSRATTPLFHSGNPSATGVPKQSKPSPQIPWSARPPIAPPATIAPLPEGGATATVPAVIPDPARPGEPSALIKARDTEGVYAAKHQKSFGRGCEGKLELTGAGLDFACTSGSEAPLHIAAGEIKGPNGNGIELKSGEKYHFDLSRSKSEEQQIFMDWAYTHVPGAYAKVVAR